MKILREGSSFFPVYVGSVVGYGCLIVAGIEYYKDFRLFFFQTLVFTPRRSIPTHGTVSCSRC